MEPGDLIQDRYSLDGPIGSGGMAEVWKATDTHLSRTVAVKFLDARLADDPEFLVRFFSEAQSAARISHPNVVGIIDFGQENDSPFLIMEYVDGGSLSDLIGEPMVDERAIEFVIQAAKGAGAAHRAGLVHRDIKPANILIADDRVKLADFGIAALSGAERLTATGDAIGSPYYISPEQAMGGDATPRSDVYALGIVLYELLTGTRPFEGDNIAAITIAQVETPPQPPSERAPGVGRGLEALVMRCLAKDPADRPENADELAAELAATDPDDDAATGMVPLVGEPGWSTRRKLTLIGSIVMSALVLVALSLSALSLPSDPVEASNGKVPLRKPRPTRSASPTAEAVSGTTSTPTPAASATERSVAEKKEPDEPEEEEEEEPTPEPSPSEPDPTPTPTSQPTTQSTPAP